MKPITLLLILLILLGFAQIIQSEVPKLINYQGKLTTPQGAPLDTTVSMQFSIYPDSTGGTPLWSETQLSVRVDKGIFNILLGSVTEIPDSVFSGAIRYLGVNVGDDPEMLPRKPIVSVAYCYRANNCDTSLISTKNIVYFPTVYNVEQYGNSWTPLWETTIPIDVSEYGGPVNVAISICGTSYAQARINDYTETEVVAQGVNIVVRGPSVLISTDEIIRVLWRSTVQGQTASIQGLGIVIERDR